MEGEGQKRGNRWKTWMIVALLRCRSTRQRKDGEEGGGGGRKQKAKAEEKQKATEATQEKQKATEATQAKQKATEATQEKQTQSMYFSQREEKEKQQALALKGKRSRAQRLADASDSYLTPVRPKKRS